MLGKMSEKESPLNSRHLVDPKLLPALDVLRRTLHARL